MQPMEVNYEYTLIIHEVRHDSSSFTFRPEGASDGSTKDLVYVHIGFFNEFPIGFINMCFSFPKKVMKYCIPFELNCFKDPFRVFSTSVNALLSRNLGEPNRKPKSLMLIPVY